MKYFCLWLFLFSVFSVHAETMEWRPTGKVSVTGKSSFGAVYRAECNNIMNHAPGDSLNALSVVLYKNKKERRKLKQRFISLDFFIRLSPYTQNYTSDYFDKSTPFYHLNIGLSQQFRPPENYAALFLLFNSIFDDIYYNILGNNGIMNILTSSKIFTSVPDELLIQKGSVRYAPYQVKVQLDQQEHIMTLYINGRLQGTFPMGRLQGGRNSVNAISLVWDIPHVKFRKMPVREFEISAPEVTFHEEPDSPQLAAANPPRIHENHYDSSYEQARMLLYSPENNWEKAFEILQKLVERGHAPAMYELALCYYRGLGCSRDREKALHYSKLAAENGMRSAFDLRCMLLDLLFYSTTKEFIKYTKGWNVGSAAPFFLIDRCLIRGCKRKNHEGQTGKIFKIKNNKKAYAFSLYLDAQNHATSEEQVVLAQELRRLAQDGFVPAMGLYANLASRRDHKLYAEDYLDFMKKAFLQKEVNAVRYFVQVKRYNVDWNSMDLETRFVYANDKLLQFGGINPCSDRRRNFNELHVLWHMKGNKRAAYAYAEYLLKPSVNLNKKVLAEAEAAMLDAAASEPLAQAQYIRRYLDGFYGNATSAQKCLKALKVSFANDLLVQELEAELQEKLNPGKCQPLWEKLLESNSIPALYFIGQYASRAGNKVLAAKCRYEFIQKDNMRRCIQNGMNSLFGEEGDGLMFDGFLN